MDALRVRRMNSTAAKNVVRFILETLLCIYQNPQVFGHHSLCVLVYAAIHGLIYLLQRGSILQRNVEESTASSSSDSLVGCPKNSSTSKVCESDGEALKSSIEKDDSTWENDLGKPAERSSPVLNPDHFDARNRLSMLRMKDIISILGDCRAKSVDIAASGKNDLDGFFKGLESECLCCVFNGSINLHVSLTGKATKIPEEHDWVGIEEETLTVTVKTTLCDHGTLTREPSDTGSTQKGSGDPNKTCQTLPDGGGPSSQVAKVQNGSISYSRCSSGSGGDDGDGDDNRKQTGRIGGCQGSGGNDVDNEDESKQASKQQGPEDDVANDDDDCRSNEENHSESQRSDESQRDGAQSSSSYSTVADGSGEFPSQKNENSSCSDNAKKAAQQDESEEICRSELHEDLQKAFTCRRNLNSEREWQKCTDAFCQLIQYLLDHSQNCRMRVLGGCEDCISYKDMLFNHVSTCILPLGRCVVARCDYIREYMCTNCLPENRKWTWALDQLFFRPTPPSTPTNEDSEEFLGGYKEVLTRPEAANPQEDTVHDPVKDILIADRSLTSNCEPLRSANGWNQYHVDRPPDVQVTRGPVIQESIQAECEDCSPSAPLSVADVSVTNTCTSQTVGSDLVQELGEVIWPLNQVLLINPGSYVLRSWVLVRMGLTLRKPIGKSFIQLEGALVAVVIFAIPIGKFESNEIEIWGGLSGRHPNILELYGAMKYRQSGTVIIFMEYMSGGSVEEYAGQMEHNEIWAIHVLGKVLSAVDFMHLQGILHRDVKGGNVLVDETGQHVKLADFGTSIRCESFLQDNIPRGTEPFMSPEMCRSECHSFSTDIWSIMCLLYQLLAGRPPWVDSCHGSLIYRIGTAKEPPSSPPCSPEVEDLFSQGFILKPADRKTARELLRHPAIMAAPDTSGFLLPTWGDTEQYSDGASSISSFSNLVLSLSADELERHVLSNLVTDVSENDVNQLRDDNFDVSQVLGLNHLEIQSIDDLPPSSTPNDWSYSITDLAKIRITDNSGKWLFSIRERPTTAYGRLAEDLHGI
ncbi:hypothetical protein pdam_00021506, partial [Pocillopora damicornis]